MDRAIVDCLRQEIESGQYRCGEKLPSEKELCSRFNASRSSLREALSALEYVGLLEARGGSGYYILGNMPIEPEEVMRRSATKVVYALANNWNIKIIKTLIEYGLDGVSIMLDDPDPSEWGKQARLVRQAAHDAALPVALLAEIPLLQMGRLLEVAEFVIRAKVDAVVVNALHGTEELLAVRRMMDNLSANVLIMARIDKIDATIGDTLRIVDGIIIAPVLVATNNSELMEVVGRCNLNGKIIMFAACVQETSVPGGNNKDIISRAALSGCDGVLIQTEGAARKFPLDVLRMFKSLAKSLEERTAARNDRRNARIVVSPMANALCSTAVHAAEAVKAMAYLIPSDTGFTPRLLAKFRQGAPIIAVSVHDSVVRQLKLVWGVQPLLSRRPLCREDVLQLAVDTALKANYLREGDAIVAVTGTMDIPNIHNAIQMIIVGDIILRGQGIGDGIISGRVAVIKSLFDANKHVNNKIVVVRATEAENVHLVEEAAGLIVEEGGLSSHAAIACLSFGKPVILGATDATDLLLDDEQVTMDIMRGLVYRGWVNLG